MVEPIRSAEAFGIKTIVQAPPKHTHTDHRKCSYTQGIQVDPKTQGVLQFMMCEHQEYAYGGFYSQDYVDQMQELIDFLKRECWVSTGGTISERQEFRTAVEHHLRKIEEGVSG